MKDANKCVAILVVTGILREPPRKQWVQESLYYQPNQHTLERGIPQNDDTFAVFDPPVNG